jgi:hypothetical protein
VSDPRLASAPGLAAVAAFVDRFVGSVTVGRPGAASGDGAGPGRLHLHDVVDSAARVRALPAARAAAVCSRGRSMRRWQEEWWRRGRDARGMNLGDVDEDLCSISVREGK